MYFLCQFWWKLGQSPGLEVETIWQTPGFTFLLNLELGVLSCAWWMKRQTETGKLKISKWSFTAGLDRKPGQQIIRTAPSHILGQLYNPPKTSTAPSYTPPRESHNKKITLLMFPLIDWGTFAFIVELSQQPREQITSCARAPLKWPLWICLISRICFLKPKHILSPPKKY